MRGEGDEEKGGGRRRSEDGRSTGGRDCAETAAGMIVAGKRWPWRREVWQVGVTNRMMLGEELCCREKKACRGRLPLRGL